MEHWCPTEHWCSLEHGSCHHHRPPFLQLGRQSEGKRSDLERRVAAQGRLCPGCCGVKPPSASKGQGIEDQTLPALPAGAGHGSSDLEPQTSSVWCGTEPTGASGSSGANSRAPWERHILLRVCKGCGGRRVPHGPGKPGLAAEPKESQPLLAMGGLSHTTFSGTEPQVTHRHSMTRLGDVAASWLPWCVSQGLLRG